MNVQMLTSFENWGPGHNFLNFLDPPPHTPAYNNQSSILRFKKNWGGGQWRRLFFVIFGDPPAAYFDPPFINFLNFSRDYTEVHKYIIDSWCFVGVSGSAINWKYQYIDIERS